MRRPPLALLALALFAWSALACAPRPEPEPGPVAGDGPCEVEVADGALYASLFETIAADQGGGEPAYRSWPLFPGTTPLRRLGLPVHGRWTTVYADPEHAFPFLQQALAGDHPQPLELPPGSILVKENYRPSPDSVTNTPDESDLEVLTVMYKPLPGDGAAEGSLYPFPCVTDHLAPYNGDPQTGCLGGRWFWAFYKVEQDRPTACDTSAFGKLVNANVNQNLGSFCVHCHAPAYESDYLRILHDELDPFTVAAGAVPTGTAAVAPACQVTLSPNAPPDVPVNPLAVWRGPDGSAGAQGMVDCFSWRTFVALNWPADPGAPGRPDPDRSILDLNGPGDGPTVWQTYLPVYQLFQPGDLSWQPPPFDRRVPPDAPGCNPQEGQIVVTLQSKARDIPNETGQAFAGTFGDLRDRNRNLVWYEVLINEIEYDYIVDNGLAATAGLTPGGPAGFRVDLPYNATVNEPSIEIKSAWKVLCSEPGCRPVDDPSTYLVSDALIFEGPEQGCTGPVPLGLVGLHVAVRTFWAPQWIWATFEHESNAPTARTGELREDRFSFHDPALAEPADCFNTPFLVSPAGCPNVTLNRFAGAAALGLPAPDSPNQITRLVKVDAQAQALNPKFQGALRGTPFEHYLLVNAQWPLNGQAGTPDRPEPIAHACAGNTLGDNCYQLVPEFLRNTVIESYMTTYVSEGSENLQISNRSCLRCHVSLGPSGSYVWLDAVANQVPVAPPGAASDD